MTAKSAPGARGLGRALRRAGTPIVAMAVTYACAVAIGGAMVHAHCSPFDLVGLADRAPRGAMAES